MWYEIILTSSVMAALISTLSSMYSSKRSGNLKYITEERQKWREEIRQIAEDIEGSSRTSVRKHLIRLKVRINANGKAQLMEAANQTDKNQDTKKISYYEDCHIWELIKKLENSSVQDFKEKKENLINSLSLLLKYDWERQKREVLGSKVKRLHCFLYAVFALVAVYMFDQGNLGSISFPVCQRVIAFLVFFISNIIIFFDDASLKLYKKKNVNALTVVLAIVFIIGFIFLSVLWGVNGTREVGKTILLVILFVDYVFCIAGFIYSMYSIKWYEERARIVSGIEFTQLGKQNRGNI